MGLRMGIDFKGITASYWSIVALREDIVKKKTMVVLGVYLNKDAKLKNSSNVLDTPFGELVLDGIDMTRAQIYDKVKEHDLFKPATDWKD